MTEQTIKRMRPDETFRDHLDRADRHIALTRDFPAHNDHVRQAVQVAYDAARAYHSAAAGAVYGGNADADTVAAACDAADRAISAIRLAVKVTGNHPSVGDGATYSVGSDRYAGTVIEVSKSGHRVVVQNDIAVAKHDNPYTESQEYEYSPDPNGRIKVFTRRKNGIYRVQGWKHGACWFGYRAQYEDPHF